jgi:hypothetical protein
MFKRLICLTAFALSLVFVRPAAQAQRVENLALNPSFEEDEVILDDPAWEQWATWGYESGLNSTVEIDETEFVDGERSLKIVPTGDTNWYFIVLNLPIMVDVDKDYTISFWAKAREPRPLTVQLKATDNSINAWGATDFELTTEWAEYHYASEVQIDNVKLEILCSGSEVPFWLDFINMYEGDYVPGIEPSLASPPEIATDPVPADGSIHPETWANISWEPGIHAVSHDFYFGDIFDDVDAGTESTFQGNQAETFAVVGFPGFAYPEGLVPGTTYYWRIDEVNEAEPNSPWKGDVWSFSIPPKTAYFPEPADNAEGVNINVELSWTPGFGAKLHTVYFGESFEEVDSPTGGQTQGTSTYNPGTLEMAKTYYWRVDEFDAVETYKGDVWSFITEGAVSNPTPANGAVDVTQSPILTWQHGIFADNYEVYFGTDEDSLDLKKSGSLGQESYDATDLEWGATYYWRIDETNDTHPDSPWTGPLWSFTTASFLIIDDMESYNDLDPAEQGSNRIFNAWVDGFGEPSNGSLVGYDSPPFAEQTVVHSGNQSMPFFYDNAAGISEATLTLTENRDWTIRGASTLTIWYRGDTDNAAEPMYVALNDSAVVTNDSPEAAQNASWTEWNIDLQAFADQGMDLSSINSLTLGFGNRANPAAGGSGTVFFDDIRLYAP